jgi:hypothetical protein
MEYTHRLRTKNKWLPWLNEAERVLAELGEEVQSHVIYERTKDRLYWTKVPKSVNAAAQILRYDRGKRFYQTPKDKSGYHHYGLTEWLE